MKRDKQKGQPHIYIRGVDPWTPEQGREPVHIVLSQAEQAELVRLSEVIVFKTEGSQIFSQGQPAAFLYYLADGVVQGSHILNHGDRQIVAFYWPRDLFGLAEQGVYVNSAQAVTPCKVYRFPVRKLQSFLLENPKVQQNFLINVIHAIRSAQRQLIVMGRFNVLKRLAIFLLDCTEHEHYFDSATQVLTIPMTRTDIADYIGTSAESVARAMSGLEDKGLIRRLTARMIELRKAELKTFASLD